MYVYTYSEVLECNQDNIQIISVMDHTETKHSCVFRETVYPPHTHTPHPKSVEAQSLEKYMM